MLTQLSARIRDTNRKVGDLAFKDVSGRIAHALLELCDQPGAILRDDGIGLEITRQELARIVGCSREMASRVLHALEHQHILSVEGKIVVVHVRKESPQRSIGSTRIRVGKFCRRNSVTHCEQKDIESFG